MFYDPAPIGVTYQEISERAANLETPLKLYGSRLVLHIQTSEEAVDDLLRIVRELAEEKKAAGFVRPAENANGAGEYRDVYVRVAKK